MTPYKDPEPSGMQFIGQPQHPRQDGTLGLSGSAFAVCSLTCSWVHQVSLAALSWDGGRAHWEIALFVPGRGALGYGSVCAGGGVHQVRALFGQECSVHQAAALIWDQG